MFDTLQAAKTLREAGFEQAQAEAMAAVVGQATNGNRVNREHLRDSLAPLATKADLYRSLGVWGITITAINVGATVSLIKFLP